VCVERRNKPLSLWNSKEEANERSRQPSLEIGWDILDWLLGLMVLGPGSAAAGEVITIKFGNSPVIDDPECLGALRFGELAEKKTGGRVKVQVYPLSQLGAQREMLEGLRLGTIEMTMVTVGFMSSYDPFLNIFELPYCIVTTSTPTRCSTARWGKMSRSVSRARPTSSHSPSSRPASTHDKFAPSHQDPRGPQGLKIRCRSRKSTWMA